MDRQKYIRLSDEERRQLGELVREKRGSEGRIRRARILLTLDLNGNNVDFQKIAAEFGVSVWTVKRVYSRHMKYGLRGSVFASRFTTHIKLRESERLDLHNIIADPSSHGNHVKTAKILLEADFHGGMADAKEIADRLEVTDQTVVNTIKRFNRTRLKGFFKPRSRSFRFRLKNEDRFRLQELLKKNKDGAVLHARKYARILVLLNMDVAGAEPDYDNVAVTSGVTRNTVAKICRDYMSSGLESVLTLDSHRYAKPKRKHIVRLNKDEREKLNQIAAGSGSAGLIRRARILLYADENGPNLHNDEIAAQTGVCVVTVRKTCERFARSGVEEILSTGKGRNVPKFDRGTCRRTPEIRLKKNERKRLEEIVLLGGGSKSRLNRARILLAMNDRKDEESLTKIAREIGTSLSTINLTCNRYFQVGLIATVDRKNPQEICRRFLLDESQEARIIEMFKANPPAGKNNWTLDLLTEQTIIRSIVPRISRATVRKVLQKHGLQLTGRPGRY